MSKIKIEISVNKDVCGHWDFGNFKSKVKTSVEAEWWNDYLQKRADFERLHEELIRKTKKKLPYAKYKP